MKIILQADYPDNFIENTSAILVKDNFTKEVEETEAEHVARAIRQTIEAKISGWSNRFVEEQLVEAKAQLEAGISEVVADKIEITIE